MTFVIADLPYFESVYSWYDFTPTLTSPRSLCVKVSPSLWWALLSASQSEKEGFKATLAINSKKQILRQVYLLFCFLFMFWLISDLGFLFFLKKSLIFVFCFAHTCLFAVFANLFISSFLLSLTLFFSLQIPSSLCSLGGIAHYLSSFPLIPVCSFLLFYSIAILVALSYELWFDLIWFDLRLFASF